MKWIPVEEALPKSQNEYLVTVNFDGDTYVECLHYGKPLMANREVKGECFYDSDDEWGDVVYDTGTEVIAWMPLPQPYKADRKTEPQTEEWHDDCNTCRWHDGACTIPCCDYEPKTEPQFTEKCPFDDSLPCEWVCTEYGKCKYKPQTDCSWK